MIAREELEEFFAERTETFLFLSHIFFKELTCEEIEQLALCCYSEDSGNEQLNQGYRLINRYFCFAGTNKRSQLACEYARVFLAAGTYTQERTTAIPYESAFTSEEQLMMQDARDDVLFHFRHDGFKIDPSLHEPEDHLSFELEYLSCMSKRAKDLSMHEQWNELELNIARQSEFIELHLLNWLPALLETAQKYAQLTFYIGMLLVTIGYLQDTKLFLEEVGGSLHTYTAEHVA